MSESVYYKYGNNVVKVHEFRSKKTRGMDIRKNLKPCGGVEGRYSTEIGDDVEMEWINHEDYLDEYGPNPFAPKKKEKKEKKKPICLDDYGPNEEQLLREIREENKKLEKTMSVEKKSNEKERCDELTVIILNTDKDVCEYDIYEMCREYGNVRYIYNTNSKYNNIIFVSFYDKESAARCNRGVQGKIYKKDVLETRYMIY
jgi:hypothetical protein